MDQQTETAEGQARGDVRSSLAKLMGFTDPGTGKHFQLIQAPIEDLRLTVPADQLLARVDLAYPDGRAAFVALFDALDRYQAAIAALPPEKAGAKDGETLWLPGRGLGPAFDFDDAATAYFDAIAELRRAAQPVRHLMDAG